MLVLRLVLEHVYEFVDWPQLKDLHRRIYRDLRADFDVRKVAARLAPSSWAHSWTLQETLSLPASAFRELPEAAALLDALVQLVRYAVDRYRASTGEVEVTEREVAAALNIKDPELRLLPLVAWREPFITKGQRRGDEGWVLEISDEIVRLDGVADVEGYLAVQDAFKARDDEEQAAMARAHLEMIEATSGRTTQVVSGADLEGSTEPQARSAPLAFFRRHKKGLGTFAGAVLAGLVISLIEGSLFEDGTPPPPTPATAAPATLGPTYLATPSRGATVAPGESMIWWGGERATVGHSASRVHTTPGLKAATGNFNDDGFTDLIWYSAAGRVFVWWGTGDEAFDEQPPTRVAEGLTPTAGDFDGDGVDDVYWYGPRATEEMWWGDPEGEWTKDTIYPMDIRWDQLIAGDYNGDRFDDICFYRNRPKRVECENDLYQAYWWGTSDRDKLDAQETRASSTGCYYKFFADDLDGNGIDDFLAYGLLSNPRDSITFHDPFSPGEPIAGEAFRVEQNDGFRPAVGDFDGDGNGDIFWFAPAGPDFQWWGSTTRVAYGSDATAVLLDGEFFPIDGDFNGDERDDILWYAR